MRDVVSELKKERDEVKQKSEKLDHAIANYKAFGISANHASLMSDQWRSMKSYISALDNRIKDLEK